MKEKELNVLELIVKESASTYKADLEYRKEEGIFRGELEELLVYYESTLDKICNTENGSDKLLHYFIPVLCFLCILEKIVPDKLVSNELCTLFKDSIVLLSSLDNSLTTEEVKSFFIEFNYASELLKTLFHLELTKEQVNNFFCELRCLLDSALEKDNNE